MPIDGYALVMGNLQGHLNLHPVKRAYPNVYSACHLFIFFHVEENEPKEDARAPLDPVRHHVGRRARKLAALRQVRALFPPAVPMLGAGQRGEAEPSTD